MTDIRTVVTVYPMSDERPVRYADADYGTSPDRTAGALNIVRRGDVVATWAAGTWQRAELTQEPVAPAEPEEPAAPGTFEVYEDNAGKWRFRLKAHNGEVIAVSQAYTSRSGAHAGVAAVQRAAKSAPIEDVDQ